ncbi:hypothetical protein K457DRAFT_1877861 [Linnemannia elongata AG-77]|uniref:Uncharacterized protein n=1 Tax=Linnemannia elongata AG-77 TaxID=1314771 RepID=A0A197JT41_9FUNG|nr:hypothetical protein K457DRAFT_1877861 [Linnemannia elongata AG-77]
MVARKSFCILLFLALLVTFSSVSSAYPVLNEVEKRDVSAPNRLEKRFLGPLLKSGLRAFANPATRAKFARVAKAIGDIKSTKCTPQKRSYFIQGELMKRDGQPPAEAGQTPTGQSETRLSPEDEAAYELAFQELFGVPAESVPENDPDVAEMLELYQALYALDDPATAGAGQP